GSNEIRYDNFQQVKTDILLINLGLQIHLFQHYTEKNTTVPTRTYPENTENTRYKDTTAPAETPKNTRPTPVKKKTPKVKPDGPKRDPNARG
ncbi:MAG: hypothetical protein QMC70_00440, partial [Bacteroidia bacterium]